jgi:phage gp36-like protein
MAFPYGFTANDLLERFSADRLVQITDVVNAPPETRDDVAIEKAAIDTAAELEKHGARYYVFPLTPFPTYLRADFLDLWAWRLLFNVRPDWVEVEKTTDGYSWADRRKELVVWLNRLSSPKREAVLPGCQEVTTRVSASGVAYRAGTPVMTPANLWKVP